MKSKSGFTLVEISIVMIIIGLLIGGTFGGMRLIENANIQKVIRDFKAIESSALTFKDTYGRIPGDIRNPSARLPNCTTAPCATTGNGNRILESTVWNEALTDTMEKFTFWNHLSAADILSLGTKNTIDMTYGEGQPDSPLQGGYRLVVVGSVFAVAGTHSFNSSAIFLSPSASAVISSADTWVNSCVTLSAIDAKTDDGYVYDGAWQSWGCSGPTTATATYDVTRVGALLYDLKGF